MLMHSFHMRLIPLLCNLLTSGLSILLDIYLIQLPILLTVRHMASLNLRTTIPQIINLDGMSHHSAGRFSFLTSTSWRIWI